MLDKGDWRSEQKPETREATVKEIATHLEQFIPSQQVHRSVLKFSRKFEQHCWETATSFGEYQDKIKDEMASIKEYDQLCQDNPFTNRKYEGFLGAIRITYNSRTVAGPTDQIKRDPEDITLEESAKTVLRRNAPLKAAVHKLLMAKALKQRKGGSVLFNAMEALRHKKEESELSSPQDGDGGSPTPDITPEESQVGPNRRLLQALNPIQKKNKIPGF
ncbi:hypothetical protein R1sor_007927 [Riccia sorocarpa]|uniref:Mediator complex subunit 15 KIX domain-containing protein n=1 Tax=Riccia sorocarpa TaxID=122646 RepID=A0ABD3HTL1_9MARC